MTSLALDPGTATVAAVLAGGAGRRFGTALPAGGKGLLTLHGRSLIAHGIAYLEGQTGGPVVVNINPAPHPVLDPGLPQIDDGAFAGCGPLAGLQASLGWAALHHPDRPWLLTMAVDTPFLPPDLMARLGAAADPAQAVIAASTDGLHPTIGLWHGSLRDPLAGALRRGVRAIRDWLALIDHRVVTWPDPAAFANLNTPDDLAAAERRPYRA